MRVTVGVFVSPHPGRGGRTPAADGGRGRTSAALLRAALVHAASSARHHGLDGPRLLRGRRE